MVEFTLALVSRADCIVSRVSRKLEKPESPSEFIVSAGPWRGEATSSSSTMRAMEAKPPGRCISLSFTEKDEKRKSGGELATLEDSRGMMVSTGVAVLHRSRTVMGACLGTDSGMGGGGAMG